MTTTEQNIVCLEKMKFRDTANPSEVAVITTFADGASAATTENSAVGTTTHFNGSVTAGDDVTLPAVADKFINSLLIQNLDATNDMGISFDGGTNFKTILAGQGLVWSCQSVKQFVIKANAGTINYEILVNFSGVA